MHRSLFALLLSTALLASPARAVTPAACSAALKRVDASHQFELLLTMNSNDCKPARLRAEATLRGFVYRHKEVAERDATDTLELALRRDLNDLRTASALSERRKTRILLKRIETQLIALRALDEVAADAGRFDDKRFSREAQVYAMNRILSGQEPPTEPLPLTVAANWTLHFGGCGTGAANFGAMHPLWGGLEDAWRAVDRPDLALMHLTNTQWIEAMNLGLLPPRLREFGEALYGEAGYAREIEIALASIRIDETATGRFAQMPLFNRWLPLPIARGSWEFNGIEPWTSPEQIAAYLRPIFAGAAKRPMRRNN